MSQFVHNLLVIFQQFLFSDGTNDFLLSCIKKLTFTNILCIGTPRYQAILQIFFLFEMRLYTMMETTPQGIRNLDVHFSRQKTQVMDQKHQNYGFRQGKLES